MEAAHWLSDTLDECILSMEQEVYYLCLENKLRLCWEPANQYGVRVAPTTFLMNWFGGGHQDPTRHISVFKDALKEIEDFPDRVIDEGWIRQENFPQMLDGLYEIRWKESSLERWLLSLAKQNPEYDQMIGGLYLMTVDGSEQWVSVMDCLADNGYTRDIDEWFPTSRRPKERELIILQEDLERFVESTGDCNNGEECNVEKSDPFFLPEKPDDLARAICGYGNDYFSRRKAVPEPMVLMELVREDASKYGVQKAGNNAVGIAYINSSSELKEVSKKSFIMRYNRYLQSGSNKPS
jgi:hypothetical protein